MSEGRPIKSVEIYLPSILGYEKIARNAAAAIAQEMGFSDDRIDDLQTAVAEACMNAIEHGNRSQHSAKVTVLLTVAETGKLEVRVTDEGHAPLPDELPQPGSGEHHRGWGIFFIEQLMDQVEFSRLPEGGNSVRMTIYLTPETQQQAGAQDGKSTSSAQAEPNTE
ncbi:MAG: ATP-binding protein [Aggregatilineales bacterium]